MTDSKKQNGIREIDDSKDIAKKTEEHNHTLLCKIKENGVKIVILLLWILSVVFMAYIIRYLYLSATVENSPVAETMEDIIIKVSGWALFILMKTGVIKNK